VQDFANYSIVQYILKERLDHFDPFCNPKKQLKGLKEAEESEDG
jgi:hypothetical protein